MIEGDVFKTIIRLKEDVSNEETDSSDDVIVSISAEKIIEYLKKNSTITNKEARDVTGLQASRIRDIFKNLLNYDIIELHGENKNRYYTLK